MVTDRDNHTAHLNDPSFEADLAGALAASQFFLLYQPTIDLQSGAFVGVEALLRWRHHDHGVVPPDVFLPTLESTGQIVPVGAWVLREACRQGAEWHSSGHRFTVSVNVAQQQLVQPDFPDVVERAFSASRFDPEHLVLELSEHSLDVADKPLKTTLTKVHELGVLLAIDDFGKEPSSKDTLATYPIDIVKIDRAFISSVARSADAAERVHELVQLGKALNVRTIAQGIEDDDQRLRLQVEDVDVGQGFLFSVPHDAVEIDAFLEDFAIFSGKPL